MLLQIFYRSLDYLNKIVADNVADGSIVKQTYSVVAALLNEVTKQSRGWHIRNTEVAVGSLSASLVIQEQRKKDEEKDENMAKVMT